MIGLFNTLNMGARAMAAEEVAVEVTGQNLANASNSAYSRQTVRLATSTPTSTSVGMEGTGVEATSIQQTRSALLDSQIRSENSVGGYWNSQQTALQDAETQLDEYLNLSSSSDSSSSSTSLSTQLSDLFSAFQSVATSPTDSSARVSLVEAAQTLASTFNQASENLSSLNDSLNASVSSDVTSANQLLSEIAELNGEIARATATGGTANDLVDSREADLESLAKLTNISTTTNTDGTISVSIGGQELVSGSSVSDTLATYTGSNGNLLVETASSQTALTLSGGSMAGTIDARDGALATLRGNLDTLASSLITQVNDIYSAGYDLNGDTGADFFTGSGAGDIAVNTNLVSDPSLVQASGSASATGDNSVALQLAELGSQTVSGLNDATFSDAYALDVENFGYALSTANDQVTNYTSVSTLLANQRDSVSGVSQEEEITNLITYQKAYEASSKIITTVSDMLETVVNLKS